MSASLEDGSDLARTCRLRYDARRRTVLEALDWGFARRRTAGQAVLDAVCPPGFDAAWQVPTETLRLRAVWDGGNLLRWTREALIFTPAAAAVQIVTTADFHDPTRFPPIFTQALEFVLAAEFAMIFARSVNRADVMMANYRNTLADADALEAAERSQSDAYACGPWVDAIRGGWTVGVA